MFTWCCLIALCIPCTSENGKLGGIVSLHFQEQKIDDLLESTMASKKLHIISGQEGRLLQMIPVAEDTKIREILMQFHQDGKGFLNFGWFFGLPNGFLWFYGVLSCSAFWIFLIIFILLALPKSLYIAGIVCTVCCYICSIGFLSKSEV